MADFDAPILTLTGLAVLELPDRTLRLCDGAYVYVGADKFEAEDAEFGSIKSVDEIEEKVGDDAPDGSLTFLPASTAAAAILSRPEYQGSPLRFYLARVDDQTGTAMGDPELLLDAELDTTTLLLNPRRLEMTFISIAERLWNVNEGNVLSDSFHQSVWPGELGMANATGVPSNEPWGVEGPPRGSTFGGGGFGGGGGGGFVNQFVDQL